MAINQTHGDFEDVLAMASPDLRSICVSLRNLVSSLHPEFFQVVWPKQRIASFGVGPKKATQHYAYISIHASHVNLGFYHGTSLNDAENMLEGTGKSLRHVKIRDLAAAERPEIKNLLLQAVADRKLYK